MATRTDSRSTAKTLTTITGSASASGEGLWTIQTAKEMGIPVPVIEDSLKAREVKSERIQATKDNSLV